MSRPPATGRPCVTCGVPHEHHPKRGYRAEDGHPYLQGDDYPPLAVVPDPANVTIGGGVPDGYEYAILGGFYRCQQCRALLERHDPEVAAHTEHHAQVDRALAEAWRLLNGGGAA